MDTVDKSSRNGPTNVEFAGLAFFRHQDDFVVGSQGETDSWRGSAVRRRHGLVGQLGVIRRTAVTSAVPRQYVLHTQVTVAHSHYLFRVQR